MSENKEKKKNIFARMGSGIANFFKSIKSEFKKIIWPAPKKLFKDTLVVIVTVIIMGAFLSLVNWLLLLGVEVIIP